MSQKGMFEHKGKKYVVKPPTVSQAMNSEIVGASSFRHLVENGLFLQSEIEKMLVERGIVTSEDVVIKEQYNSLLESLEQKLNSAKTEEEKSPILQEMGELATKRSDIFMKEWQYTSKSADSLAAQAARSYLIAACTIDVESGTPIWCDSMGNPDYLALQDCEDQELAGKAYATYLSLNSEEEIESTDQKDVQNEDKSLLLVPSVESVVEPVIVDKSFPSGTTEA